MGGGNLVAILYKANETDFSHLGLGVLNESVSNLITEERNGVFELEMKYPTEGSIFKELKLDRLIKADANHNLKDQRFKIIRISKPMDGVVTVFAEHISYLSQDLALKPKVVFNGNATVALNAWKNGIVDSHPFTFYSDIATTSSGEWSIKDLENARQALGGIRGSVLDNYGGEYEFDNYDIRLYANRGRQSDMLIAYGRNLTELTQEETIDSTFTSIYPYTITTENETDTILTLPEYFVDSQYVGNFARRKIMKVDFSQDGVTTVEQLRAKANAYILANGIGIPKVNLKVKFIDLAKSLDYKNTQSIEEINLCDWVTVYFENFDIQTNAKIIKVVWDEILEQYDSIEIGEARASLSNSIDAIVDGKLDTITQNLNTVQRAANGKNKVYRGVDEPTSGMVKNDLWYKPVGAGEIELYNYDGAYWKIEKVSAGLLGGTLDAENGDVNLINVNVANIVGETSNFIRSGWNENGSDVQITGGGLISTNGDLQTKLNAGSLSTSEGVKSGTVNALGFEIYDSSNGQTTKLFSDGLEFKWYDVIRRITQTSEGLRIKPETGSGNRLNSSLELVTGPGNDKVAYLQLGIPDAGTNARLQLAGNVLSLRHPTGGQLSISDYNFDESNGLIRSGKFRTSTTDGRGIEMVGSQISALAGNQTIYCLPTGTGEFRVGSGGDTPTLWPVRAQSFVQGSSKDYKTNIENYTTGALSLLNSMNVVSYDLIKDVESGVINKQVGFISEDNLSISSLDEKGIDIYRTIAVLVKGVQESSEIIYGHETKIAELEKENKEIRQELKEIKEHLGLV